MQKPFRAILLPSRLFPQHIHWRYAHKHIAEMSGHWTRACRMRSLVFVHIHHPASLCRPHPHTHTHTYGESGSQPIRSVVDVMPLVWRLDIRCVASALGWCACFKEWYFDGISCSISSDVCNSNTLIPGVLGQHERLIYWLIVHLWPTLSDDKKDNAWNGPRKYSRR